MAVRLPRNPDLQQLRKRAKHLVNDHRAGEFSAVERVRQYHRRFAGITPKEALAADFSLQDAQLVIAGEFGQRNWSSLVGVVELMRQVHQGLARGGNVHVLANDVEQADSFEALLQPHYSADQLGVLSPYVPGESAKSALSRSILILAKTPIIVAEYQILGLTRLMEHLHNSKGPFRVDARLASSCAVFPGSLHSKRPVILGARKHADEASEFDPVLELSTRQLCALYRSVHMVNL